MIYNIVKLNSARNCLRYLIRAFDIKEIFIPFYICSVVRDAAYKEGCKLIFYHIDEKFNPVLDFPEDAFILYPNYFGICSSIVKNLSTKYKNLIVDNAHSFFSQPLGIAAFSSVRKFFPDIRNGAVLYSKKKLMYEFLKDDYVYEYKKMDEKEFLKNEYFIDSQPIKYISDYSNSLIEKFNVEELKISLKNRFDKYHKIYGALNCLYFDISDEDIPYKYPLLLSDASLQKNILSELEKDGICVFRYWNNLPNSYPERIFYDRLIVI